MVPSPSPAKAARFSSRTFLLSLLLLAVLPLVPEALLLAGKSADFKAFVPVAYYELIVSFLLLTPGLLLGRWGGKIWVALVGGIMALASVVTGFQAASVGARWDVTAHAALLQTSPGEAWGFVRAFGSAGILLGLSGFMAAFVAGIALNLRSAVPSFRVRLAVLAGGLLFSGYGIRNAVRYNGSVLSPLTVGGQQIRIANIGVNKFHPVILLAATHHNYVVTHAYYLGAFHFVEANRSQLAGAGPVAGAVAPRVVVVVIGESASRRHWSLYGYGRETTPEMTGLGDEVLAFSDVISFSVGTQTMLRGMFSTTSSALPVFPVFSGAGYMTHWLSAQYNQGENDVEVAALVQSCDQRVFLNGAHDGALVPLLRAAVAAPGPQVVFVNLFGSHVRYSDRYPREFEVFFGDTEKDRRLAAYDNSIRYTDHVLAQFIGILRERPEASCLLYVSDHAEDVYDSTPDNYLFRSDAVATNAMYEVPFLVWLSPAYRKGNPEFSQAVARARARPFQTQALYQSIIDLARLRHPLFDPTRSLFAPEFVAPERRVGVMNRVYTK